MKSISQCYYEVIWEHVYKIPGTSSDIHWMLGHHRKKKIANILVPQLILKIFFFLLLKLNYRFFFPLPFQFILVEDSLAGPCSVWKVILCMNLFWHLFLPSLFYFIHCQGGILIGTRNQVKQNTPSEGHTCRSSVRIASFLPDEGWLSSPSLCCWGISDVFLALSVSFLACLIHQHHKALSAQTQKHDANVVESI